MVFSPTSLSGCNHLLPHLRPCSLVGESQRLLVLPCPDLATEVVLVLRLLFAIGVVCTELVKRLLDFTPLMPWRQWASVQETLLTTMTKRWLQLNKDLNF